MTDRVLTLSINGEAHRLVVQDHRTLLEVLREDLGLTGTKHGCELGECGACTVLINGATRLACLTLAAAVHDVEIITVEGLAERGVPHPLQTAFAETAAAQCGYCTPGMLMSAKALLDQNPDPATDQIKDALGGNLCRCTGYLKILEAVHLAAERAGS